MGEKLPQNADDWLDVVPEDDDWTYYTDHRGVAFPERSVVEQLQIYVPPLLLITGTIGNILSAIVLWKFIQKVLSTCLYLFVVQISDLIVLYLLCGNIWFDTLTGLDIRKKAMLSNNSVCKYYVSVADLGGGGGADPAYAPPKIRKNKVGKKSKKKKSFVEICSMKLCSRDTRE